MAATVNFSWTYPTVGADLDTWGGVLNSAFIAIDADVWTVKGTADAALPKAGGTMTGKITLDGDPTAVLHAASKQYVDAGDATKLNLSGGTLTGSLVAKKAYTPSVSDVPSSGVLTINTNDGNVFKVAMNQNVTSLVLSNPSDGQTINVRITQPGAGGPYTITWPSSFKWANGVTPVLSTAANAVDLLVATYFADTGHWYASLSKTMS